MYVFVDRIEDKVYDVCAVSLEDINLIFYSINTWPAHRLLPVEDFAENELQVYRDPGTN